MAIDSRFRFGLEVALERPPALLARGAKFGLLMNQASVDRDFRLAHELLHARFPGQLAALFSPQHGLFAEQQDNMVESGHGRDPLTGAPVFSLYSETRRPRRDWLAGLDALVVDLQDVGCRVYTFVWTVSHCLEACAEAGIPLLVLDRPNPLGGEAVEGAWLDPRFASFVGRAPMPMRHDLTMGELALWVNEALSIGARVEVVRCEGLTRAMGWRDLGRPWVPTSPNLPRSEGVDVYPGQVVLEGTTLSEGRGSTTPFELWGAPAIDPWRLRADLAAFALPGVAFRPVRFEPTFHKHRGESCGGLFLHVTDRRAFQPYRTTLALLAAVKSRWPEALQWKPPPYEYEREKLPIDCIAGGDALRRAIDGGELLRAAGRARLDELCDGAVARWRQETARARLYGERA
ncbi:MAG: DUF1343 domain-containing protein [Planctomycetes bacterium]|nr:DUF1343 domain-containing protein [Planctomycetota bacterium]